MEPTNWQKKLPMWITYGRVYLGLVVIGLMSINSVYANFGAALIFILASISDYYDGYFARKYGVVSNLGKFMDPIADKILVTSVLVMLVTLGKIDAYLVIIILARDTFIGGIRSVAAADQIIIDAKPTGKWKTALQMVAIPAVIIDEKILGIQFDLIGYWVLWVSVVLSVWSGIEYYLGYKKSLKSLKK